MDPEQCRDLIEGARLLHAMRGGTKGPAAEEQVTMDFAFATVVTIAPVQAGELFTEKNLWAKRPGTGAIPAERYEQILGKRARRDIEADTQLTPDDIADATPDESGFSDQGPAAQLHPAHLEVVDQRPTQRLPEQAAQFFVRGMPEVGLQAGEIVELDDRDVVHRRHRRLVTRRRA